MTVQEAIEKMAEYKRAFQVFFFTLLVVFVGISFFYREKEEKSESKFTLYSKELETFLAKRSFDETLYTNIVKFLKQNPASSPGNEQKLTQHLFTLGERHKALFYAHQALKRTKSHVPYYHEYAYATLLIEEQKYEEALRKALDLQQILQKDDQLWNEKHTIMNRSAHLMASNLLRIATLQRMLGQQSQELKALTALREFLGLASGKENISSASEQTRLTFISDFSSPACSLADFINERERVLR